MSVRFPYVAMVLLCCLGFGGPASAQVITLSSAAGESLCLDVAGAGTSPGTNVQVYSCNGKPSQRWTVGPRGELRSSLTHDLCLAIAAGSDNAVVLSCFQQPGQRWAFDLAGRVVVLGTGQCLTAAGEMSGSNVAVADCGSDTRQQWTAASTGFFNLFNGMDHLCLDVQRGTPRNGTKVQVYGCNGSLAQQWQVTTSGTIQSALGANVCLDVAGGATAPGTGVDVYQCNGTAAQQWAFISASGVLASGVASDRCLSIVDRRAEIHPCTGQPDQQWDLMYALVADPGAAEVSERAAVDPNEEDPFRHLPCGIRCVRECTTGVLGIGPLFNPICYAICVGRNCF